MVSIKNYFTILILMVMVFVMFMFIGVSTNILSNTSGNTKETNKPDINISDTITADSLNLDKSASILPVKGREVLDQGGKLRIAILSGSTENINTQVLIEWCVYNKYLYKVFSALPDKEEIAGYDAVLFGDYEVTAEDSTDLYAYADLGKTMIFTGLPDYQVISKSKELAAFFGIKGEVAENVTADGIKIFSNFMINKERIYTKGDYFGEKDDTKVNVPYYSLAAGYEVYAVGMLKNQEELKIEDKDLPPLLWRTATRNSFVCVVNCDIFDSTSLLGVLTGFMAHQSEYYLYPIINAQTISLLSYPYFSDENYEVMNQLYSRNSEAVARDLLWPNIIQILKKYGGSYNFFAAPQLNYLNNVASKEDYLVFYLEEIEKLSGGLGLSLGQVSGIDIKDILAKNELFFRKYLPDYHFTAIYSAGFSTGEVEKVLDSDFLQDINLVMSDYKEGDSLLGFLNDKVLSVKYNLDGYRHETMDDLRMSCIENALGMCNMGVDIKRVLYPQDSSDEWNNLSLKWSKGNTYFKDYSMLDMVSVYEMEERVRRFLALDYSCEYKQNTIDIHIDHFEEEAYFILNTSNKRIDDVENGTAKKISDTSYLIKAQGTEVKLHMKEENVLEKPENNKLIPSNAK